MLRTLATIHAFLAQVHAGGLAASRVSPIHKFTGRLTDYFIRVPAASHERSLSSLLLAGPRPQSTRYKLASPRIGQYLPSRARREGLLSRRKSIGAIGLTAIGCNFIQFRTPVALAVSSDEDRTTGQGDEVLLKYKGFLEDGTVFDSSDRKELIVGGGQIVTGFDDAIRGMRPGEKKKVTLPPDQAYGQRNEDMLISVPKADLPPELSGLKQGKSVGLGGGMVAVVSAINKDTILLDANPPLAGKTLTYDVELVAIKNPPLEGKMMIGWQGKQLRVPFARVDSLASKVLKDPKWPAAWPYKPADFQRQDESTDEEFYNQPRFVTHIDNGFISAIKSFYDLQFSQALQDEYSVLDICSSWISHYPADLRAKRIAVTGMNELELKANKQATEYAVKDLNVEPKLSYGDNEFDFVTNVVSVDYLNKPQEIFKEMHRVLKPGGVAIMSFSNRCFATKAIAMWVASMNDGPGHCQIVGNYFHFSPMGGWKDISSVDISPNPGRSDPVWVVTAVKS